MNDNKDYSIDDILAEFSSYSENMITSANTQESDNNPPASNPYEKTPQKAVGSAANKAAEDFFGSGSFSDIRFEPAAKVSASNPAPGHRSVQNMSEPKHSRPIQNTAEPKQSRPVHNTVQERRSRPQAAPQPARTMRQNTQPERQILPEQKFPSPAKKPMADEEKNDKRGISAVLSIIFAVLGIFSLCWVLKNVHPDSGTVTKTSVKSQMNLAEKFDNYVNNAASDALKDLTYIPKIYTIGEEVNVAPKPNPNNFGSTTDPQEVMKVIESAAALLDGQEVAFNPDANFIPGSEIKYYLDDTILAITWKEDIDGKCCSCAEIKIAHGSQIRRKVAGDSYSVGKRYYASDMAKECNSVVAINGDFYDFRQIGVTVFQRQLFRFVPDKLDSCHITSSGDLLFSYAGDLYDEEYTKQFIKDNDVIFTLSFGPILADNGELREVSSYPIGEINTTYSRSAIGQFDKLHYVLMTVNYDVGYTVAATLNQVGRFLFDKGCPKVYGLDGGQTSVLMMNGECVNHVDYGYERTMSDIIYFATAIPDEEAAQ